MTPADRLGEECWTHMSRDRLGRAARLARRSLTTSGAFVVSVVDGAAKIIARDGCEADHHVDSQVVEACRNVAVETPSSLCGRPDVGRDASLSGKYAGDTFVGVPVRLAGEVVGVVCATGVASRRWTAADIEGLVEIAASLSTDMTLKLEADARDAYQAAARNIQSRLLAMATNIQSAVAAGRACPADAAPDPLAAVIDELVVLAAEIEPAHLREWGALASFGRVSPAVDPQPVAGGAMILLADDVDLNRKLIADMLSLDGHQVDCVADGAEAVRAVAAKRYDLVLMDMIMPNMDGVVAARAIRSLPRPAADVPIIALTANAFQEQLDICLDAGMNAALTKPMSIEALAATVAAWIRPRTEAA